MMDLMKTGYAEILKERKKVKKTHKLLPSCKSVKRYYANRTFSLYNYGNNPKKKNI